VLIAASNVSRDQKMVAVGTLHRHLPTKAVLVEEIVLDACARVRGSESGPA